MQDTDNNDLPLAYRVKEACAKLAIGRSMLYEEIAAGRLRAVKAGSRTLIPVSAAKEWLNALPDKPE